MAGITALASPKSITLTAPSGRTITLAGFRSRSTIPGGMRYGECRRDGAGDSQRLRYRHALWRYASRERRALDVLHGDEVDAVRGTGFINRHDVRVIQCGGRAGFAKQAERMAASSARAGGNTFRAISRSSCTSRAL